MANARVPVILFDENSASARALAEQLSSEAVTITVVHDVAHLGARLSDMGIAGIIACVRDDQREPMISQSLSALTGSLPCFQADALTPVWELQDWLAELTRARAKPKLPSAFEHLLGQSAAMSELREQVRRVAQFHDLSVLITGETGTGKEVVAQAIHQLRTKDEPFVSINCAAIPAPLFEAELFGHTKDAFTGAEGRRQGLFEQAGAGTVFLDEIGELPTELQPKLLRSLETRRFRRVGAQREQPLRARVVCATHVDLLDAAHHFRSDLYFRLSGYVIHCPPLRVRRDDIDELANHFLAGFCRHNNLPPIKFSPRALELLSEHPYPGNVRELRGLVESLAMGCIGRAIESSDVHAVLYLESATTTTTPPRTVAPSRDSYPSRNLLTVSIAKQLVGPGRPFTSLDDLEKHVILAARAESAGCLSRMSKTLGVARSTLRDKLRRYALESLSKGASSR